MSTPDANDALAIRPRHRASRGRARRPCAGRRRLGARSAARRGVEGCRPRDLRRPRDRFARAARRRSAGWSLSGAASPCYKVAGIDVALPRRESKSGRGHTAFAVEGDPSMPLARGCAAARLHDQRDRLGSADRRVRGSLRRARRSRRGGPAGGRPAHLRRRQPARAAGAAVRRALRAHGSRGDAHDPARASRSTICRPNASGASCEKLLLQARRPSIGFTLARELSVVHRLWPEMAALIGCEQEHEWHPEGDVWIHTLMVIDQARSRIDALTHCRAGHHHAGRGLPRFRQALDHRVP